jgi:hypothetical protein
VATKTPDTFKTLTTKDFAGFFMPRKYGSIGF